MSRDFKAKNSWVFNVIIWGSIWGIFEATAGYLLHQISFPYSWLIWYPAACFFMTNVYRKTRTVYSVFLTGLLCASIKMLNLFLPCSVDKVINPAVSIVFEALSMAIVVYAVKQSFANKKKSAPVKALTALIMNTGWRLLFALYLIFLVPGWMREISVISSAKLFIPFFITQNLFTSVILFAGYYFIRHLFKPITLIEARIDSARTVPKRAIPILKIGIAVLMLCVSIMLEILL